MLHSITYLYEILELLLFLFYSRVDQVSCYIYDTLNHLKKNKSKNLEEKKINKKNHLHLCGKIFNVTLDEKNLSALVPGYNTAITIEHNVCAV